MDLKTFLSDMTVVDRESFAKRCDSTRGVLQNIMYGVRPCSAELAVAVERESGGVVRRWDLRPDDWWRIWPELIGVEGAPQVPSVPDGQRVA